LALNYIGQVFCDEPSLNELNKIKCLNNIIDTNGKDEITNDNKKHCMTCLNCKWGYYGSLGKYVRKYISSMLKGRNSDKLFVVYSGSGDNSKSVFMKLIQKAFGDYCVDLPVSVITQKRGSSSSASPEMARTKGAHISICSEPDDDEKIVCGTVKALTGNDRFYVRNLFENGSEILPMFKLILVCNKIPPMINGSNAMTNRLRVVPFLSTFVNNPPSSEEEQRKKRTFLKDPDFDDYVDQIATALLWIAVQDYHIYLNEGLEESSEPYIVKQHTNSYWEENNPYQMFKRDCIIIDHNKMREFDEKYCKLLDIKKTPRYKNSVDNNEEESLKDEVNDLMKGEKYLLFSELYRAFKIWYRDSFPSNKVPDSSVVKIHMNHILGKQISRKWYFHSLKEEYNKI
jgi:phage/plasmid-associated DNA primase